MIVHFTLFQLLFAGQDEILTINTHLRPVKTAIWEARSEWKAIGRALDLPNGTIDSIHDQHDGEALHQVLSKWMETGQATTQLLLKALKDPTVGRNDIAKKICRRKGEDRIEVGLSDSTKGKISRLSK